MYYQSRYPNYVQFILDGDRYFETLTRLIGILYNSAISDPYLESRGQRNWIDFAYWSMDPNLILTEDILPRLNAPSINYMVNQPDNLPTHENFIPNARPGRNGMTLKGALHCLAQVGVQVRIVVWQPTTVESLAVSDNLAFCKHLERPYNSRERLPGGLGGVPNVELYTAVYHAGFSASNHQKMTLVCAGGCITALSGGLNLENNYASPPQHTNSEEVWHDTGYVLRGDGVLGFMMAVEERIEQWNASHRISKPLRALITPANTIMSGARAFGSIVDIESVEPRFFNPPSGTALALSQKRVRDAESWGLEGPPSNPSDEYNRWHLSHTYNTGLPSPPGSPEILGSILPQQRGYGRIHMCPAGRVEVCTTKNDASIERQSIEHDIKKALIDMVRNAQRRIYMENFLIHDARLIEILAAHVIKSVLQNATLPPVPGNLPIPLEHIIIIHKRLDRLTRNSSLYMNLASLSELSVQLETLPWQQPSNQIFLNSEWRWHAGQLNSSESGPDFSGTSLTIERRSPLPDGTTPTHKIAFKNVLNARGNRIWYEPFLPQPNAPKVQVHSKLAVIDDTLLIGSANFNFRSLNFDGEIDARITEPNFVTEVLNMLADHWDLPPIPPGGISPEPLVRYQQWQQSRLRLGSLNIHDAAPLNLGKKVTGGWKVV